MFLIGYAGYFAVDAVWPEFYYSPIKQGVQGRLIPDLFNGDAPRRAISERT